MRRYLLAFSLIFAAFLQPTSASAEDDIQQPFEVAEPDNEDVLVPQTNDAKDTVLEEAPSDEGASTDETDEQLAEEDELFDEEDGFPTAEISKDLEALPFPARRMRELILEATQAGDIEKLRALIGVGDSMTQLSLGGIEGDPIDYLKQQSGDPEGHELLAILEEVLEAGYARIDAGTEHETYVWPYFYGLPLGGLTPVQRVELFRILTYGDYEEMKDFGGYIFYRVGISPTGRWQFFVAGD